MKRQSFIYVIGLFTCCVLIIGYGCDDEESNKAPTCIIASPNNGDEFEQGEMVSISVDANDTDGKIIEVRFYVDGLGVSTSSSFPYNYEWNTTDEEIGNHTIKVTVKDDGDIKTTDEITVFLTEVDNSGNAPIAAFTANQTSINTESSVQFTDLSTNSPTNWSWNFGDGSTSTTQNPSHPYSAAGTYTVSLTATNSIGSDTETKTDYITVTLAGSAPVAAFTVSQTFIDTGSSVLFTDQSTNSPTNWSWNFGDGGTSTTQNPSYSYSSTGTYTVSLTATNSIGSDTETKTDFITVTTSGQVGTVSDYDGNTYNTVKIGNQWWMAENLKTTHYPNGTAIPLVTDNTIWANLSSISNDDAYCYLNNDEDSQYGALYTWAAAMNGAASSTANPSGIQGICPDGWHLPSIAEWTELTDYLGGESVAGGMMKEIGTEHWTSPNTGATNEYGFTALPGGGRSHTNGAFQNVGGYGHWWSSTKYDVANSYYFALNYMSANAYRSTYYKDQGFSVRCLKD